MEVPSVEPTKTKKTPKIYIISSLSVSCVTVAITVFNKLAIRDFPHGSSISLIQGLIVLFGIMIYWLIYDQFSSFSLSRAKMFIPSGIAMAGNFITNFYALKFLNVSTLAVMHNLNLILVGFTDYILFGRRFKVLTVISLFVVLVGAIAYSYGEITFSLVGYIWMLIHIFFHELQSVYLKWITLNEEYSSVEMSFYNSFFSVPLFILNLWISKEFSESFPLLMTRKALWPYVSGLTGLMLTNLRFFSIKTLSVTAWAALNIVNKIPASVISAYLFNQQVTVLQVVGYLIAFTGAFGFAYFGQRDTFLKSKKKKKKSSSSDKTESSEDVLRDVAALVPPSLQSLLSSSTPNSSSSSLLPSSSSSASQQDSSTGLSDLV